MGDAREREIIAQAAADIARMAVQERIRRERERIAHERNPVTQAGRALHGLWRSIITGGWE